jgi:hypothetical protein
MPKKKSVGEKLERTYEQVKDGLKDIGHGLTKEDDSPTIGVVKPQRTRVARAGRSKQELYDDAKRLGVKGRSKMTKDQLEKAVRRQRTTR